MKKSLSILILSFFMGHLALAQYADMGTGQLRNQIWWLDWQIFDLKEGAVKTFTTDDGLSLTVTFSNIVGVVPTPNVMNTFPGAILHLLYDFSNQLIEPALLQLNSSTKNQFTMTFTATRNGLPAAFTLVTADAEASTINEITTLQTDGGNWQCIEFFRNSSQVDDPMSGCGTQTISLADTYAGTPETGQNPLVSTYSLSGSMTLNVTMDHRDFGTMALAFGLLNGLDRGDLPASYGTAQHQLLFSALNGCNYLPPLPTLIPISNLYLGAVPGDADPVQYADDNAIGVDEEAVSSFPPYDGTGVYSISLPLNNRTGSDAFLTGWFDYNRDGSFESNELATVIVPNNASSAILSWTGLPVYLPQGTASGYGFRFRITTDGQIIQQATGYAPDGEVEDYLVPPETLCTLKIVSISDTMICPGQSVQLTTTGGQQYQWDNPAGLSDLHIADPIATPVVAETYIVTGSNMQGCIAKDTVGVTLKQIPVITAGNDTTICKGSPADLSASGGLFYTWTSSDGLTHGAGPDIVVTPLASLVYTVNATAGNGCSAADSVKVNVHVPGGFAVKPEDPVVCTNDSIIVTASGGNRYAWSSASGLPLGSQSSITLKPTETQNYQVQITDDICAITETLQLPVTVIGAAPITVTRSNDIDCSLGQATLQARGGRSYVWDKMQGITDLHSADPVVSPLQNTMYYVTAKDQNGCSARDSVLVKVNFNSDISKYPVASAFSPNNDGKNDCFGLKYWGRIGSLEMDVFNRAGVRVFSTTDPDGCWDGTYKGLPQPAGTYVYQIKASTPCGQAYRKGTVILIR